MHRIAVALILCGGCGKGDGKPAAGSASGPDRLAEMQGVVVTATDVRVDGKSLGVLPETLLTTREPLVAALGQRGGREVPLAYTDDAQATVVLAALRGIDDANPRDITIRAVVRGQPEIVCKSDVPPPVDPSDEHVDLSVRIGTKQRTIGVSRIKEFETFDPPYAKFDGSLKEHKTSAFFQDRIDVEVAADPGVTGADLTPALHAICGSLFFAVRPLAVTELSARAEAADGGATVGSGDAQPTPVPLVSIGQPNVQGDLDKAIVRRYVRRHLQKLSYCYEHELATQPKLAGTVATQFFIAPDGTVAKSDASGVDPAVAACVAGVIKAIEFPKPKSGPGAQVNYPMTFRPPATPAARGAQP